MLGAINFYNFVYFYVTYVKNQQHTKRLSSKILTDNQFLGTGIFSQYLIQKNIPQVNPGHFFTVTEPLATLCNNINS